MKNVFAVLAAVFLWMGIISAYAADAPSADAASAASSSAASAAESAAQADALALAASQGVGVGTGGAGGNGGGASLNNRTTNNTKAKFINVSLPTAPAVAPTVVGTGSTVVTSQCGPLLNKVRTPIEYLLIGRNSQKLTIAGQNTDDVVPYRELYTDDNGNPIMVPVVGPDGKPVMETVIDLNGKKKVQPKLVQKGGPVIKWEEVYEGNGIFSQYGSIYSEAAITVTMSMSKQWLLSLFGNSGGGNASNGMSGTITGTQRIIALGRCQYRKYQVVVDGTRSAQVPVGDAVMKTAPPPGPDPEVAALRKQLAEAEKAKAVAESALASSTVAVVAKQGSVSLEAPKVTVLAPTGKYVLQKAPPKVPEWLKRPEPEKCNGKPVPSGYRCAFIRDKVDVVKDASLKQEAGTAKK